MGAEVKGKFSLLFDVGGEGQAQLGDVMMKLTGIGDEAEKSKEKLDSMMGVLISDKIIEKAEKVFEFGKGFLEGFVDQFKEGIEKLMPIETTLMRVTSLTKMSGDAARGMVGEWLKMADVTPFRQQELVNMGMALVQARVNMEAFKDEQGKEITVGDAVAKGWTGANAALIQQNKTLGSLKVSALTLMADLAASQGKMGYEMQFFVRDMQHALSTGNKAALMRQLPHNVIAEIFGEGKGKGAVSGDQAMKNLFEYLKKNQLVGTVAAAGQTFEGLMSTMKDIPFMLYKNILGLPGSGGLYDRLKAGFASLVNELAARFYDPKFLQGVKDAFEPIISLGLTAAEAIKKVVLGLLDLIRDHPMLLKVGLAIGFIGSGVLMVASGMVILTAAIAGAHLALVAFGPALIVAWGTAITFLTTLVGVIGLVTAAGYALYLGYQKNFGNIQMTIAKVVMVFKGLYELISSTKGVMGEMSTGTMAGLEETGLLHFVIQLYGVFIRVKEVINGLLESLGGLWDDAKAILGPALDELSTSFTSLTNAVEQILIDLGLVSPNDLNTWKEFGTTIGNVARALGVEIVDGLKVAIDVLKELVDFLTHAIEMYNTFKDMDPGRAAAIVMGANVEPDEYKGKSAFKGLPMETFNTNTPFDYGNQAAVQRGPLAMPDENFKTSPAPAPLPAGYFPAHVHVYLDGDEIQGHTEREQYRSHGGGF